MGIRLSKLAAVLGAATLLAGAAPRRAAADPFLPGEELKYTVDWLSVKTGTAVLSVGQPQGEIWPLTCQGKTEGLFSLVTVKEHLVTYWDANARASRGSDLNAVEMSDRHFDSARFDREQGKATVLVRRKGREQVRVMPVPGNAQDIPGALFFLRTQPLAVGQHLEVPVFTNNHTFTMSADVVARENVETPAGHFTTLKLMIRTQFDNKFAQKRDTVVWMTDDEHHVPVRISADFVVGSITATLTNFRPGAELARR